MVPNVIIQKQKKTQLELLTGPGIIVPNANIKPARTVLVGEKQQSYVCQRRLQRGYIFQQPARHTYYYFVYT